VHKRLKAYTFIEMTGTIGYVSSFIFITSLKMVTGVAETCRKLLYIKLFH
jgi:hypothetical protein